VKYSCDTVRFFYPLSALLLLIGWQEGHLLCTCCPQAFFFGWLLGTWWNREWCRENRPA